MHISFFVKYVTTKKVSRSIQFYNIFSNVARPYGFELAASSNLTLDDLERKFQGQTML